MAEGPRSMCFECIHANDGWGSCTAFPDGIPNSILLGDVDHRVPVEGDGGIQFVPVAGSNIPADPSQEIPGAVIQPDQGGKL